MVEQLARYVARADYGWLSEAARNQIKSHILDSLGCALGAMNARPIRLLREHTGEFGGKERCMLIGGGRSAPDRAAFFNSALVRYLDFNDSFLASGETCHPSDNLGGVLAAAEDAGQSGRDLLTALAVAYQVQCRLSETAPVRAKGFDHTTQGAFALAAGVSKALGLSVTQTANAIAIAGTAFNALRVTRTGTLSQWKGLAYPNTAFGAVHAAYLARKGITGPLEVFEGNKGFMETISGPFKIDWEKEGLEIVTRTDLKKFNAEMHSQAVLEGVLELKQKQPFTGDMVTRIDIETFGVAYHIIGGGEEGDKTIVATKEQADHSLPYVVAVAILDGQVMPGQFSTERIQRPDVQQLLRKVVVRTSKDYDRKFPAQLPSNIRICLKDGAVLSVEKRDYEGFHTRPMSRQGVVHKFEQLGSSCASAMLRGEILDAVDHLETIAVVELMNLLARIATPAPG
jgi:2-methylcitrate dehydratase